MQPFVLSTNHRGLVLKSSLPSVRMRDRKRLCSLVAFLYTWEPLSLCERLGRGSLVPRLPFPTHGSLYPCVRDLEEGRLLPGCPLFTHTLSFSLFMHKGLTLLQAFLLMNESFEAACVPVQSSLERVRISWDFAKTCREILYVAHLSLRCLGVQRVRTTEESQLDLGFCCPWICSAQSENLCNLKIALCILRISRLCTIVPRSQD